MNISGLIRSVIGDAQPAEPKSLELKVGQVVKGVIMQLMSEQEAVINIGGVQLRAKLETPLKQGAVTMLQVQPESTGGQVVLKPLQSSDVQIEADSLANLLKEFGMKDLPANRQLIQLMHQAGIAVTKENVQQFVQLQPPPAASQTEQRQWNESAVVAFQKGLPLTTNTVASVRQALFGQPVHETMDQLTQQVEALLDDGAAGKALPTALKDVLQKVIGSLNEIKAAGQSVTSGEQLSAGGEDAQPASTRPAADPSAARAAGQMTSPGGGLATGAGNGPQQGAAASAPAASSAVPLSSLSTGDNETASSDAAGARQAQLPGNQAAGGRVPGAEPFSPVGGGTAAMSNAKEAEPAGGSVYSGGGSAPSAEVAEQPVTRSNVQGNTGAANSEQARVSAQAAISTGDSAASGTAENGATENSSARTATMSTAAGQTAAQSAQTREAASRPLVSNGGEQPQQQASGGQAGGSSVGSHSHSHGETAGGMTGQTNAAQAGGADTHWIAKMLKSLGVEHEQQVARLFDSQGGSPLLKQGDSPDLPSMGGNAASTQANADAADSRTETLKSLLMQLAASDDAPPALKETAQQAVQQITGQQLMMSGDRGTMFTHMTLFIPLVSPDGQQTASVHIQSRKGKRGTLDADNCRLLFDLHMKEMGNTLVDVQVVDRIVSLHVHNDYPIVAALLEEHREEIASGLEKLGYQFISLKCSGYPQKLSDLSDGASAASSADSLAGQRLNSLYSRKSYKSVDVRV